MNFVPYAIPFFIIAMLVEFIYGKTTRNNSYALADTLNSLHLGTLSRLRGVLQLGLVGLVYEQLTGNWHLLNLPPDSWLVWVFAFVAYDLAYYFAHRYGHEWRILWASHVVHHQSEEYNLSTALRQTSTGWLSSIFYVPLYVLGVPVEVMISVGSLNLIYQFWVHTVHIPQLGLFEWVFVSPSNHRVHHAKNPRYIDRNYGGVFILWDRLFGTYQSELANEACRYGITNQLRSWNPLWANVHVWVDTWRQSCQTPKWQDKIRVWFKSPAWSAPGVETPDSNWRADKFQPPLSRLAQLLAFVQFWPLVAGVFSLLGYSSLLSQTQVLACALWFAFGFYCQGLLLEGRATATLAEWLRLACAALLLYWLALPESLTIALWGYILISLALNVGLTKTAQSGGRLQSPG